MPALSNLGKIGGDQVIGRGIAALFQSF